MEQIKKLKYSKSGKSKSIQVIIIAATIALTLVTAYTLAPLQSTVVGQVVSPLDPLTIPKFVNQLTGPPPVYVPTDVCDCYGKLIRQDYSVNMVELMQQILPTGFPMTAVWGYQGQVKDAITGEVLGVIANSPGPSFEATKGLPIRVTWNNLITGAQQFAVDPTLHWANPNNIAMPTAPFEPFPPGYAGAQSPVPLVTHLHGGEVPPESDGGPDAWWTNNGIQGPGYSTATATNPYSAVYDYPNINAESTIWYHDHALGVTRLNVMSGLAGFYFVRDPASATGAVMPTGKYDMPLVFQDRNFLDDGSLLFPDIGVQPAVHPYWVPEFFGEVIMVNGLVWPNMNVDQGTYRFRLLDGSNARFYTISFVANPGTPDETILPFTQIASDSGYLMAPVALTELTFAPGERVEVLVDFSGLPQGTPILLKNTANENFPDGLPVNPDTAGQLMQFTVTGTTGVSMPTLPSSLNPTLPTFPTLGTPDVTRTLTLVEVLDPVTDVPLELLLDGQQWITPAYEIATASTTEEWLVFNPTADAHPIHTHLVQFQVISRQPFDDVTYFADWLALNGGTLPFTAPTQNLANLDPYLTGPAVGPNEGEKGWKDTVIMNPREATIIRMRFAPVELPVSGPGAPTPGINAYPFDPTGHPGYVWHCHILDHEDNEMMRPLKVVGTVIPPTPKPEYKEAYLDWVDIGDYNSERGQGLSDWSSKKYVACETCRYVWTRYDSQYASLNLYPGKDGIPKEVTIKAYDGKYGDSFKVYAKFRDGRTWTAYQQVYCYSAKDYKVDWVIHNIDLPTTYKCADEIKLIIYATGSKSPLREFYSNGRVAVDWIALKGLIPVC